MNRAAVTASSAIGVITGPYALFQGDMKVILAEDRTIKGRKFEAGDEVIVNKEVGTRMVDEGIANRVIDVVENRVVGKSVFNAHKVVR